MSTAAAATAPTTEPTTNDKTGERDYPYPPTGQMLTSVTTILSASEGKPHLNHWYAKTAATFAVQNLTTLLEMVGDDWSGVPAAIDYVTGQATLIRDRKADAGKYVHAVAEALVLWAASPEGRGSDIPLPPFPEHLRGVTIDDDEPLEDVIDAMVTGFLNFVADYCPEFEMTEARVYNVTLGVAGTLDAIIILRNVAIDPRTGRLVPCPGNVLVLCIDIKTGKFLGVTVREQLAAYRRMTEVGLPQGDMAPMPATDAAAVLHIRPQYKGGYRLMAVSGAKDAAAWNRFRRATQNYRERKEAGGKVGPVMYPLRPDGTIQLPDVCDLDGEGWGRSIGALDRAGIVNVTDLASFSAKDLRALDGVGPVAVKTARLLLREFVPGTDLIGTIPKWAKLDDELEPTTTTTSLAGVA